MDPDVELSIEGRLVLPDGITPGVVGMSGGRIVAIKKVLEGDVHYDMSNCLVVPAAVDMHVHFRQPGDPRKGTFRTESRAAAFGGVTTVADMPNNTPPTIDARSWNDKVASVKGESFVDYALYMGLTEGRDPALVGFTGLFKLYIASTTGDLLVRDERAWISALAGALEEGARVVVHAEDQDSIERAEATGDPLERHSASRPPQGEAIAVEKVAKVAVSTGRAGHCHVAHLSCREALVALGDWGCSAEVAPHHLFLDTRREDLAALGKVNPPLRTDEDRAALWSALASGAVPVLASDHAPHTREEKARPFDDAPSGIPGVETMVPMAMVEARGGRISIERLVDATATRPAAFLGLGRRALEEGLEAHVAVYDPRGERRIRTDDLHQHCGFTPYEGMRANFPVLVVAPWGVLVDDGEFQQSRPWGRYVGPTLEDLRDM